MKLARSKKVMSVPKIIINDTEEILGDQPYDAFLEAIEKI